MKRSQISKKSSLKNRYFIVGIIFVISLGFAGCHKKEVKKKVVPTPPVVEQEDVIKELPDEEAEKLINKVREYAESFDIGTVDNELQALIKSEFPKGSKAEDIIADAREVISPFIEAQLKGKIVEGLDRFVGKHTKKDVQVVYEEMDQESLLDFIIQYEIEQLKMEGYLR